MSSGAPDYNFRGQASTTLQKLDSCLRRNDRQCLGPRQKTNGATSGDLRCAQGGHLAQAARKSIVLK
jgi:hypothetical protein